MMEYKGYFGRVEFDDSVNAFVGSVVNCRDTITFQATDVASLVEAFHDSVDDYLDWCASEGVQPEKPYSGKLQLRLGEELHKAVALAAAAEGESINAYITRKLREDVEDQYQSRGKIEL